MLSSLRVLLLCIALASVPEAMAQYTLTSWGVQDGLPQGSVRCVTQTRDGYLWAGTWNGLGRFDGFRFTSYHSGNTPALTSSSITSLCSAKDGTLWIGTDGGGAVRYRHGIFTRFDSSRGIPAERILDIVEDHDGKIWFSTELGFYVLDADSVRHYSKKNGLISSYAGCVLPLADGSYYFGMVNNASQVRVHGDSLEIISTFPAGGFRIDADSSGALWYFLPHQGLVRRANKKVTVDSRFMGTEPRDVFIISDQLWLATGRGIYIVTQSDVQFLDEVDNVVLDRVVVVFKDREGNYWLSNTGRGLLRLRPKYVEVFSKRTGFASDFAMCGLQDRSGRVWVGTWDKGLFRSVRPAVAQQQTKLRAVPLVTGISALTELKEFSDGSVWFSVWGNGLFTIRHGRTTRLRVRSMNGFYTATSVAEDADGSVWIGTAHDGVIHKRGEHESMWDVARGMSNNEIAVVTRASNGDIWVGTSGGGVNRVSGDRISTFTKREGLSDNFVSTIYEDSEGTVWIATARGLNRWKPDTPGTPGGRGRLTAITARHGLYDDATHQMIEDNGNLWIGSIHGIYRVSKKELNDVADGKIESVTCLRIGKADGMLSEECGARGNSRTWRSSDGRLWFSTSVGVVAFDPRKFDRRGAPPAVILEEAMVENEPVELGDEIVLQPGQTRLDVRYTGINLSAPNSVRFKYTLEGLEGSWNDAGQERVAHYTNLDPGSYRFRVTASSNAGIWNEEGASVRVTVIPPIWKTWWFRGGIALLLAGSIVWTTRSIVRRKTQRQIEAAEREAALERQRLRIARDLHDELGARLTEIGLMTDVARKERKPKEKSGQLEEIATASRSIVDSFREIVWTVSPQQDTLSSLVDFLEQYAARFLKKAGIRIRFEIPADIPSVILRSEMRHGIFMVAKEALNNVVKHSRAREVTFSVQINPTTAVLILEDNGRGFSEKRIQQITNGLVGMRKRLSEVGGEAEIRSVLKKGTWVKLVIPIKTEALV